jgi:acid stress chaperone HdeB
MRAILAAAVMCVFASAAGAAVIDLSKKTCQQFVQGSKEEMNTVISWLDGFYHDEDNPPVIDTDELASDIKSLSDYCTANPTASVEAAAAKVFGGQ